MKRRSGTIRNHPAAYGSKRWRMLRRRVLERDGWRCRTCGKAGRLEVDHVIPIADGGDWWAVGNLQALCRRCHIAKTAAENRARRPVSPEVAAWRQLVGELL